VLTRDFLTCLFPELGREGPYIYLVTPNFRPARKWAVSVQMAYAVMMQRRDQHNVYFSPTPSMGRSGREADAAYSCCVWTDIDREDGRQRIEGFDLPPSFIVVSGTPGHVQAYWAIERTTDLEGVKRANYGLALALGGDTRAVRPMMPMRMPGSFNLKDSNPSRPLVTVEGSTTAVRKVLSNFDQWAADPPHVDRLEVEFDGSVQAVRVLHPWARKWLRDGYTERDALLMTRDHDAADFYLCRLLAEQPMTIDQAWAVIRESGIRARAQAYGKGWDQFPNAVRAAFGFRKD